MRIEHHPSRNPLVPERGRKETLGICVWKCRHQCNQGRFSDLESHCDCNAGDHIAPSLHRRRLNDALNPQSHGNRPPRNRGAHTPAISTTPSYHRIRRKPAGLAHVRNNESAVPGGAISILEVPSARVACRISFLALKATSKLRKAP